MLVSFLSNLLKRSAWIAAAVIPITCAALAAGEDRTRPSPSTAPGVRAEHRSRALGLQLRDMTDAERRKKAVTSGIYVERATGTAATAGVRAKDIVLALNSNPVADVESFWHAAERANWKFQLTVKRGGAVLQVTIET